MCTEYLFPQDWGWGARREAGRLAGERLAHSSRAHICTGSPRQGLQPQAAAPVPDPLCCHLSGSQGLCPLAWQLRSNYVHPHATAVGWSLTSHLCLSFPGACALKTQRCRRNPAHANMKFFWIIPVFLLQGRVLAEGIMVRVTLVTRAGAVSLLKFSPTPGAAEVR